MELDATTFALQIVNFLVLMWLLQRLLYKPVMRVIAERQAGIDKTLSDARKAQADADALRAELTAREAALETSRREAVAALDADLAVERERRMGLLDAELAQARTHAEAVARALADAAAQKARTSAQAQAFAQVEQLLRRLSGPELDAALLQMFVSDWGAMSAEALAPLREAAAAEGAAWDVATPRPLSAGQLDTVKRALERGIGRSLPVRARTDEALVSGLRAHLGPWTLAASVADELRFFREGLTRE